MQRESANSLQKTDRPHPLPIDQFMQRYNPDFIITHCKGLTIGEISTLCLFAETPTLAELQARYGKNMPIAWLMTHLYNLSEFCGAKEKMDEDNAQRTAFIIQSSYFYLKASEILLFFYKFSTGRYGRFYGTTDPTIILNALHVFVHQERNPAIERHEQAERIKQLEEERRHAVTYEQYLQSKQNYTNNTSTPCQKAINQQ